MAESAPVYRRGSSAVQPTTRRGGALAWSTFERGTRSASVESPALPQGWYRLEVATDGPHVLAAASIRFVEDSRPSLQIRLEQVGPGRFGKTLKAAAPIARIDVALEGANDSGIARIAVRKMSKPRVVLFLAEKGLRYVVARRGRIDWKVAFQHLRAALRPSGNFALRSSYDGGGENQAYAQWRAIHEADLSGTAEALRASLGARRIRIAVATAEGLDAPDLAAAAQDLPVAFAPVDPRTAGAAYDYVLPWSRAGRFRPGGLARLLLELESNPGLAAAYADSDRIGQDGKRSDPRLKPGWDRELLYGTDYIRAPLLARYSSDLMQAFAAPAAPANPTYALALWLVEHRRRAQLGRVADILFHEVGSDDPAGRAERAILEAHLRGGAEGVEETGPGLFRPRWPISDPPPRVSIIIPSRDNLAMLGPCIESIRAKTAGPRPEIVVADNGSVLPATRAYLDRLATEPDTVVVPCPGPFNFAKINNDARRSASGDVLVFLNDDTRVLAPGWLGELASLATRPDVGAVGALLLYGNGTVQHAGMHLGFPGVTDHAFRYAPGTARGYMDLLRCRREIVGVTGACLAVSAETFDAVAGFDEALKVAFNDLDLCLRLHARGLINLWTPWALLEHLESVSRGVDATDAALLRQSAELALMQQRWGEALQADPYYHPKLNRAVPDYRLGI